MSKYTDADKLKEILKLRIEAGLDIYGGNLKWLLESIDSLQLEQPGLPGIEDPGIPGKDYIPVEWVDACEKYGKWKIVKQDQPEVDLEGEIKKMLNSDYYKQHIKPSPFVIDVIKYTAHYFYELGKNSK